VFDVVWIPPIDSRSQSDFLFSDQAAAVIHMLERRAGEDNFKRLLQRLLAVSHNSAATAGETQSLLAYHVIALDAMHWCVPLFSL